MDEIPSNYHEVEIYMRQGVVFWVSRVHCIISYDDLRQRCSITFSKGIVWILEKDSHMHL